MTNKQNIMYICSIIPTPLSDKKQNFTEYVSGFFWPKKVPNYSSIVCPRSLDPFYIVLLLWVNTSWTDSTCQLWKFNYISAKPKMVFILKTEK